MWNNVYYNNIWGRYYRNTVDACVLCSIVYGGRLGFSIVLWKTLHVIGTANEGPVRIQYNCLVTIDVFPEM
jgi:hypothetical protein